MLNLVVTAALKKGMVLLAARSINEPGETFTEKRRVIKIFCCLAYLFFNVGATIFAQISKDVDGSYPYNTLLVPAAVEIIKFITSLLILVKMQIKRDVVVRKVGCRSFIQFAIPGFCYFVSNNCMFYVIRDFGPAKYQIFSNLKILSSGFLMRIILKRNLLWIQWKSLLILIVGAIIVQLDQLGCDANTIEKSNIAEKPSNSSSVKVSYIFVLLNAFFSGAGAVFSEKLLKGENMLANECIHWQNIQLYFFGIIFGIFPLLTSDSSNMDSSSVLTGLNLPAFFAILSLAASGLSVSYILKYLDNIAKCFIATFGMILVAVYEKQFNPDIMSPTMNLILGIILTGIALEQYHV